MAVDVIIVAQTTASKAIAEYLEDSSNGLHIKGDIVTVPDQTYVLS